MKKKTTTFSTRIVALALAVMAFITAIPFMSLVANAASTYNGGGAIALVETTVYSNSACTTYKGKIYALEGFTILNEVSTNVFEVEYSTGSGMKNGYIRKPSSYVDNRGTSCVATVKANTNVYYGDSASAYVRAGSVGAGEHVVVVARGNGWSYIEYNTSNGRKRGYVVDTSLTYHNEPNHYDDVFYLDTTGYSDSISGTYTVYAGPTSQYASVGSVSNESFITYACYRNYEGSWARFIEYNVAGSSQKKCGYILTETE